MEIRFTKNDDRLYETVDAINSMARNSRFTLEIEVRGSKKKHLKLKNIRLKDAKPYCGSHPNACEIGGGVSRKGKWLEGADWVEFNDRLNDTLDNLNVSANIRSSVCIIRKGLERRTAYESTRIGFFYQWDKDDPNPGNWGNFCGKIAPNSEYPFGTPGEYEKDNQWLKLKLVRQAWEWDNPPNTSFFSVN